MGNRFSIIGQTHISSTKAKAEIVRIIAVVTDATQVVVEIISSSILEILRVRIKEVVLLRQSCHKYRFDFRYSAKLSIPYSHSKSQENSEED